MGRPRHATYVGSLIRERNGPRAGAVEPADQPLAGFVFQTSGNLSSLKVPSLVSGSISTASTSTTAFTIGSVGDTSGSIFGCWRKACSKTGRSFMGSITSRLAGVPTRPARLTKRSTSALFDCGESKSSRAGFKRRRSVVTAAGTSWTSYEEQETDVNLAVRLVEDALTDKFDLAMLITADSDMIPAVKAVRRRRPELRIVAVAPPARRSGELERAADGHLRLSDAKIRRAQLPDAVHSPGRTYHRPERWK
jgi:NYN domain